MESLYTGGAGKAGDVREKSAIGFTPPQKSAGYCTSGFPSVGRLSKGAPIAGTDPCLRRGDRAGIQVSRHPRECVNPLSAVAQPLHAPG